MKLVMPLHKATALAFYGSTGLFSVVMIAVGTIVLMETDVSDFPRFLMSPDSGVHPAALLRYAVFYVPCLIASLTLGGLYGSGALKTKKAMIVAAVGGALLTAAILLNLDVRFGVFAAVGTAYATVLVFRA